MDWLKNATPVDDSAPPSPIFGGRAVPVDDAATDWYGTPPDLDSYIAEQPERAAFDTALAPKDRFKAMFEHLRVKHEANPGGDFTRDLVYKLPVAKHVFKAIDERTMGKAFERVQQGKPESDEDYFYAAKYALDEYRRQTLTMPEQIFSGTVDSLSFATEMLATAGIGRVAGTAAATRAGAAGAGKLLSGAAGFLGGAAAQAAAMPGTYANIPGRMNTQPVVQIDPNTGKVVDIQAQEGEGLAEATAKSYLDTFIEVGSEKSGELFGRIPGLFKDTRAGKALGNAYSRFRAVNPSATAGDLVNYFREAGIQGPISEWSEERIGEIARGIVGLDPSYGITGAVARGDMEKAKEQALVEAAVLAPLAGMSAVASGAQRAQVGQQRRSLYGEVQDERQARQEERTSRQANVVTELNDEVNAAIMARVAGLTQEQLAAVSTDQPTRQAFEKAGFPPMSGPLRMQVAEAIRVSMEPSLEPMNTAEDEVQDIEQPEFVEDDFQDIESPEVVEDQPEAPAEQPAAERTPTSIFDLTGMGQAIGDNYRLRLWEDAQKIAADPDNAPDIQGAVEEQAVTKAARAGLLRDQDDLNGLLDAVSNAGDFQAKAKVAADYLNTLQKKYTEPITAPASDQQAELSQPQPPVEEPANEQRQEEGQGRERLLKPPASPSIAVGFTPDPSEGVVTDTGASAVNKTRPTKPVEASDDHGRALKIAKDVFGENWEIAEPTTDEEREAVAFVEQYKRPNGQKLRATFYKGDGRIPGLTVGGRVYLRSGLTDVDQLWRVVGDEVSHGTGIDLKELASEELAKGAEAEYLANTTENYRNQLQKNPQRLRREATAHLVGKFLSEKGFRDQLRKESPTLWERIADAVLSVVGAFSPQSAARQAVLSELRAARTEQPAVSDAPAAPISVESQPTEAQDKGAAETPTPKEPDDGQRKPRAERRPVDPATEGESGQRTRRERSDPGANAPSGGGRGEGSSVERVPEIGESDRAVAPKDEAGDARPADGGEVPQKQDDVRVSGSEAAPADSASRREIESAPAAHRNVRIDPEQIGAGGPKAKYRDNVAAIKLYKELQAVGRKPTEAEQATLAKYVGWGMFGPVFSDTAEDARSWAKERDEIKQLLTPEEWEAAANSTINAHYTAPQIVLGMWDMVRRMGFKGGRVIETSTGIGNFVGMQPEDLAQRSKWTLVELDKLTGGMLRFLYPEAGVHVQGYQEFVAPDHFYDLAISNVPFSDTVRIKSDPTYRKYDPNLHDYFFLKTLDKVRPGGLVVFITSTGTLDKANPTIRRVLADKADLVGSIRLPENTFGKNAGTAVVTDLIILQKRDVGVEAGGPAWTGIGRVTDPDGGADIPINEYYANNPEQVLGVVDRKSRLYGKGAPHVSRTDDFEKRWQAAIERLPQDIATERNRTADVERRVLEAITGDRSGQLAVDGDRIYRVEKGQRIELPAPELSDKASTNESRAKARQRQIDVVKDIQPLREAWLDLVAAELQGSAPDELAKLRKKLNQTYDKYVKNHGAINDHRTRTALKGHDDDYEGLSSLELWDKNTKKANKADIFDRQTIKPLRSHQRAATPAEAVAASLDSLGRIDLKHMAKLLDTTPTKLADRLVKEKAAYEDPSQGWVPAEEYLSGNVREKLRDAEAAAQSDKKYQPNVQALKKVIPKDVPYDHIIAPMSAPWLPPSTLAEFAAKLVNGSPEHFKVRYIENSGEWTLDYSKSGEEEVAGTKATERWGTDDVTFIEVVDAALSGQPIRVTQPVEGGGRVFDQAASEAANEKVEQLKEEFADWIWADEARRETLAKLFNEKMNAVANREFDGSHLTFPGMIEPGTRLSSSGRVFKGLRKHQSNAVWRALSNGVAMFGHEVGTGKTMTFVATAMELRRLGLANKPAIVVPNSRVEATVEEAKELYPNARIMAAARSMGESQRKATVGRIATGDFDMIILTHENLSLMPVSRELREQYIKRELDEIKEMITAEGVDPDDEKALKAAGRGNLTVKRLRAALLAAEERLKAATDTSRDSGVTFEQTGIDFLLIDEAHLFKSLPVRTRKGNIKGVDTGDAARAVNLEMISSYLTKRHGGRGLVLATGTPIRNSVSEVYVWQRLLQRPLLEKMGLLAFDAWADTFGQTETKMEFTHTGKFESQTRFSSFINLPELRQMIGPVLDVVRVDENPELRAELKRPAKVDVPVVIQASQQQLELMKEIGSRAEALKGGKVDPTEDNHLKLATDGANGALDIRLVYPGVGEDRENKSKAVVTNLLAVYAQSGEKASQMVFAEKMRSGKANFDLGEDIKAKLTEAGFPASRVLDFRGVDGDKRQPLVAKLRQGGHIAIGDTKTLGTGVNAQDYLAAIHHLDAPWTPDYVEQRIGRMWRQGNTYSEVQNFVYLTAGTLDSWKWQTVNRKHAFILQFLSGDATQRTLEESDEDDAMKGGFAKFQALSSGNPLQYEKLNLDNDVARLERSQQRFNRQRLRIDPEIAVFRRRIEMTQARLDGMKDDSAEVAKHKDEEFVFKADNGREYTDKKDAAEWMGRMLRTRVQPGQRVPLGTYKGFKVYADAHARFESVGDNTISWNAWLQRKYTHEFSAVAFDTDNPTSVWQSIEYNLRHINDRVEEAEKDIERYERSITALKEEKTRPWRDAEKYTKKVARREAVTAALEQGLHYVPTADDVKPKEKKREVPPELPPPTPGEVERIADEAAQDADREEDGPELNAYGFFGGGKIRAGRRRTDSYSVPPDIQHPNEEIEKELIASRGVERRGLMAWIRDAAEYVGAVTTRTFRHLPNTTRFAPARWFFLQLQTMPSAINDEAIRMIGGIVNPLDGPNDMEVFQRSLLVDNVLAALDRGEPMPFTSALDADELELQHEQWRELRKNLDDVIADNEKVQAALEKRKLLIGALVKDLIQAELLPEGAADRADSYFHQMVLAHQELQRRFGAGSTPQRVRHAYRKQRMKGMRSRGTDLNYNTSYLEAEAAWLTKALGDLRKHQALKQMTDAYDRLPALKEAANQRNWTNLVGGPANVGRINFLRSEIRANRGDTDVTGPLIEELQRLDPTYDHRRRIAIAVRRIRQLAKRELTINIDDLHADGKFWSEVKDWARGTDDLGLASRMLLKAISERRELIKTRLGDQYATWETLAREDKTLGVWQPEPGSHFYKALTVPEEIVAAVQRDMLKQVTLDLEDLHTVLAVGGKKDQCVLPVELVRQLDEAAEPKKPDNAFLQVWDAVTNHIKAWYLLRPTHMVAWGLSNLIGDIDPILGSMNPGILRYAAKRNLWRELHDYHRHNLMTGRVTLRISPSLKAARDNGVIDSSMTAQDIPEIHDLEVFRRLYSGFDGPNSRVRFFIDALGAYRELHKFRENVLRYAAFLYFRDQLKEGTLKHYGGTDEGTVQQIERVFGLDAAAAHLSRKLIGDYVDISVAGRAIARFALPFHRWTEVNTKRYWKIGENSLGIIREKAGTDKKAAAIYGGMAVMGMGAVYGLTWLWNALMMGDEEEELSADDRAKPHLILGRREDGTIMILRNTGSLGDFLKVFGIQALASRMPQWFRGQLSSKDLAEAMAKAPINSVAQQSHPAWKASVELPMGASIYPDVTSPRVTPRDQLVSESLAVADEYKAIKGRVTGSGERGRPHSVARLWGISTVDPRKNALSQVHDLREAYLRKIGRETPTVWRTSKYKNMRDAAAMDDPKAFAQARAKYLADGGDWEKFTDALESLDPLTSRLSDEDEKAFLETFITADQRPKVQTARDYADHLKIRMLEYWMNAGEKDSPEQRASWESQFDKHEEKLRKLANARWSGRPNPGEAPARFFARREEFMRKKQRAVVALDEIERIQDQPR